MSDDGFHEIQLNGKQLVFLFMAATVVSVVIFLCGVMVGRGVRADRADSASSASDLATSPSSQAATVPAQPPPAKPLPPSPPSNPGDDESTQSALTETHPKDTTLAPAGKSPAASKPVAAAPAPKPSAVEKPAPAKAVTAEKPAPAEHVDTGASKPPAQIAPPAAPGTVASGGFAVQITALRDRGEADAIVKRLAAKGYPAYVVNPLPGKPPVYRVQVGRFPERAEAERVASRLQKEEQFSPWVTR